MFLEKDRAWMEINLDAIRHNYRLAESMLSPGCALMPVLKADAYGLGCVALGKVFEEMGAEVFNVASIDEAMALRNAGIKIPIGLMGPTSIEMGLLAADNNISLPLVSLSQGQNLDKALKIAGKSVNASIKFDSGFGRLGIYLADDFEKAIDEAAEMFKLENINIEAVFTHITSSDKPGGTELNLAQIELFDKARKALGQRVSKKFKSHCLNSLPFLEYPEYHMDYARIGVLLQYPGCAAEEELGFRHSVSIKCRILQIKDLPKGAPVSYGPEFVTLRPTKIAVVPLGYSAGVRRSLSNRGFMLLHGQKAPIIGKVCCDYSILDVTDIKEAKENDIAIFAGVDGGLSQHIYDLAKLYPASISEVTSGFTERLPRVYVEN